MLFLTVTTSFAGGVFRAGRDLSDKRDVNLRVSIGSVLEIQGAVQETTRSFYDATDQQFKQDLAERYDLNNFGMESGYATIGLAYENAAKYFTFQFETAVMNPKVDTVAQRNYYIGIGKEVEFKGGSYENMKIPEGTPFTMDIIGAVTEIRGLFTPFTFRPSDGFRITPWFDFGLYMFLGNYEIDAGAPTGVTRYLEPPQDFVIGGKSKGMIGIGMPEFGLGGEIRIGGDKEANLVLQGYYSAFKYEGSSAFLTSTRHREKNIDLEHSNYRVKCTLEIPLAKGRSLTAGVRYQLVESEASITSQAATEAEIIARRERFDKEVNFKLSLVAVMVGVTF